MFSITFHIYHTHTWISSIFRIYRDCDCVDGSMHLWVNLKVAHKSIMLVDHIVVICNTFKANSSPWVWLFWLFLTLYWLLTLRCFQAPRWTSFCHKFLPVERDVFLPTVAKGLPLMGGLIVGIFSNIIGSYNNIKSPRGDCCFELVLYKCLISLIFPHSILFSFFPPRSNDWAVVPLHRQPSGWTTQVQAGMV